MIIVKTIIKLHTVKEIKKKGLKGPYKRFHLKRDIKVLIKDLILQQNVST